MAEKTNDTREALTLIEDVKAVKEITDEVESEVNHFILSFEIKKLERKPKR